MGKKFLVEQVDEEKPKEEPKKKPEEKKEEGLVSSKEQETTGIAKKDIDPALQKKAEEPSEQSGQSKVIPKEPLEKAKSLTEQVPGADMSQVIAKLDGIEARLANLEAKIGGIEDMATVPSGGEPEIVPKEQENLRAKEDAVGFEGDTPSGPSLGTKTDTGGGGLETKDKDPTLTPKVEEPSTQSGQSMVTPDDPLEDAKALTEGLRGRVVPVGGGNTSATLTDTIKVERIMKEYVNKGKEVA